MPDPKQRLRGETQYGLEEFFTELKNVWMEGGFKKETTDKQKLNAFQSLFMLILLSSEEKPVPVLMDIFKLSKDQVKELQEAFKEEINVARHIHMKKYLDLYLEYHGGQGMTIKLVNIWIKDFVKTHIREDVYDNA